MDYGNAEMVSRGNIVPLVPEMKELPFQVSQFQYEIIMYINVILGLPLYYIIRGA